jgi:hypothetical protein
MAIVEISFITGNDRKKYPKTNPQSGKILNFILRLLGIEK